MRSYLRMLSYLTTPVKTDRRTGSILSHEALRESAPVCWITGGACLAVLTGCSSAESPFRLQRLHRMYNGGRFCPSKLTHARRLAAACATPTVERPGWRPAGQAVPAPARRVGRGAGASHPRHSPSSRTSLAPGERPARPALGPRPGRAPRRGGSGAGQRRTRHRHESTPRGDGAGVVSQERPHLNNSRRTAISPPTWAATLAPPTSPAPSSPRYAECAAPS